MLTIYTTKTCAYCVMVKKYLTVKNKPFTEVDVTDDQSIRDKLSDITGKSTVPIITNGIDYIVGWNPRELAKLSA